MKEVPGARSAVLASSRALLEALALDGSSVVGDAKNKLETLAYYLRDFVDESMLQKWERDGTLVRRLDKLVASVHAAALRGPVVPAAQIEGDMKRIMTALGAAGWQAHMGIGKVALPARDVAVMCELAKSNEPIRVSAVCRSGNNSYAQFYSASFVLKRCQQLEKATGFVSSALVPGLHRSRSLDHHLQPGRTMTIWKLTDEGKRALWVGALGANFSSFTTAFEKLTQQQQRRYFQLWETVIGNGGVMPPFGTGIAPAVRAYAILGVAERMLFSDSEELIPAARAAIMVAIHNLGGGAAVPLRIKDIRAALASRLTLSAVTYTTPSPQIVIKLGSDVEGPLELQDRRLAFAWLTGDGVVPAELLANNPADPKLEGKVVGMVPAVARAGVAHAEELAEITDELATTTEQVQDRCQ